MRSSEAGRAHLAVSQDVRQAGSQAHADREWRFRRDHLRALAQRVEVDAKEVRIMGSKSVLLRTLVAASSAKTAGFGVPSFASWRATVDEDGHYFFTVALRCFGEILASTAETTTCYDLVLALRTERLI